MKYITFVAFFSAAVFSCNSADKTAEIDEGQEMIDSASIKTGAELPENTLTILNNSSGYGSETTGSPAFDWNSFKLTKFWKEDSLLVRPFTPEENFYESYGRFLIYSPDSSHFIDLDSYNIEIKRSRSGRLTGAAQGPDTEISLVDRKKNEKTRLLFFGPGGSIEDAKWIDNETLLLIGTVEGSKEGQLNAGIFRYNIPSKTFQVYETSDPEIVNHLKGYSKRERLKSVSMQ